MAAAVEKFILTRSREVRIDGMPHSVARTLAAERLPWHRLPMPVQDDATCEVRIDDVWTLVPIVEAHARHRNPDKRCPACHGRIATQGAYGANRSVTMSHRRGHDGCTRMPRQYTGTPSPHPDAIA